MWHFVYIYYIGVYYLAQLVGERDLCCICSYSSVPLGAVLPRRARGSSLFAGLRWCFPCLAEHFGH